MFTRGAFVTPLIGNPNSSQAYSSVSYLRRPICQFVGGAPSILGKALDVRRQSARGVVAIADTPTFDHPLGYRFVEPEKREPCVLVGVDVTSTRVITENGNADTPSRIFSLASSLDELAQLTDTAGLSVATTVTQTLPVPDPATYIRSGKVSELRAALRAHGSCTAIFDVELTPAQQRSLEEALSEGDSIVKVIDRTALILEIFAQHAATREGQLQVELALYQYRLPRLTRLWTHLGRQSGSGGVGLRGPGETQLEVDRRLINVRVTKLKEELMLVRAHRSRLRNARRRKVGAPVVALIGYTNAGKSTLLNAMTGASALAANALFATLDPTTRRARLQGLKMSPEILITDTVGFVQNLPTQLVAAFRSTLEEVVEADVLVHVVDGSVPDDIMMWQMEAVNNVLEDIGAGGKPTVIVANKIDLVDETRIEEIRQLLQDDRDVDVVAVSAKRGEAVDDIGAAVEETLRRAMFQVDLVIPYTRGDVIAVIYRHGSVLSEEFLDEGTRLSVRIPGIMWGRVREFMIDDENDEIASGEGVVSDAADGTERDEWTDLAKGRHSRKAEC